MNHRAEIDFDGWMPVAADIAVAYSYVNPRTGRVVFCGGDGWMRAKARVAADVIATGQTTVTVCGGAGDRRWQRLVVCTQDQADRFFEEATKDDPRLTRIFSLAKTARRKRLAAAAHRRASA